MLSASASIAQLYIAYFNRAPEPVGFDFWLEVLDNPVTLSEIATLFSTQPETTEIYPFLADRTSESVEDFLTTVYQNLFDRDPDAEGLAFWSGVIQAGADLGTILLEIIKGASEADQAVLDAKTGVAEHWVAAAREADGYSLTDEAIDVSREAIEAANTPSPSQQTGTEITDLYFQDAARVELTPIMTALSPGATFVSQVKVADITVVDDALGSNTLGLQGDDADSFEIMDDALFLKQDAALDFGPDGQLDVVVTVDDTGRGWNLTQGPEAGTGLTLTRESVEVEGDPELVYEGGDEFLVNQVTPFNQGAAAVGAFSDDRFVVLWQSSDQQPPGDTAGAAIKARIYESDGSAETPEFEINQVTQANQLFPQVLILPDDRFLVTWVSFDAQAPGDDDDTAIKARIFDKEGVPESDEFEINQNPQNAQNSPRVAALDDGNFVVVWSSLDRQDPGDMDTDAIKARIFDEDGDAVTDEFLVNENPQDSQYLPDVTGLPGGQFVVTWTSFDQQQSDMDSAAVKARVFDDDGDAVTGEFQVNEDETGFQGLSVVALLGNGHFVVAWESVDGGGEDFSPRAIKARIFDDSGDVESDEFLVNQITLGSQENPEIHTLPDGGFVVVWQSDDGLQPEDTSGPAIKGRYFKADGDAVSDEFVVNQFPQGLQEDAAVTARPNGDLVFAWASEDAQQGDLSFAGLKARIYDLQTELGTVTTDAIIAALNPDADFAYDPAEMVGMAPDTGGDDIV